jgi:hypothetical protein
MGPQTIINSESRHFTQPYLIHTKDFHNSNIQRFLDPHCHDAASACEGVNVR